LNNTIQMESARRTRQ